MNKQEKQPDYDYMTLILKKADVYGLKQEVEETAQQYFKATAHIIPPNEKSVQALNVIFEGNLIFKTKGTVQTDQVYRKFVLNVQSRKLQRKFFFENKLHEYFSEKDFEKSFEENFHNNLSFTLSARTASRHFREELFLSIGFE